MRTTEEQCPTKEFNEGNPSGKCWGDGHYTCNSCKNYREDFNRLGQDYIDFVHVEAGRRLHFDNVENFIP